MSRRLNPSDLDVEIRDESSTPGPGLGEVNVEDIGIEEEDPELYELLQSQPTNSNGWEEWRSKYKKSLREVPSGQPERSGQPESPGQPAEPSGQPAPSKDITQEKTKERVKVSPPTPSPWKQSLNKHQKELVIAGAILLAGLALWAWYRWFQQKKEKEVPFGWTLETQKIFPIGSTVTIRSTASGKLLRFVEEGQTIPNPNVIAESGLVLDALGEDTDTASQWIARGMDKVVAEGLKPGVRLQNVKYPESFLKESPNPTGRTPLFSWQPGQGGYLWSPIFATSWQGQVLIVGASIVLEEKIETVNDHLPFFLQATPQGQILAPSKVPLSHWAHWTVKVIKS